MGKKPNKPPTTGVFQSEKMVLCQLFLQYNIAFEVTTMLGELGIAEFRDLNGNLNAYQRKYVDEIRRIGEIKRKIVYLNEQLSKEGLVAEQVVEEPPVPRYKEILRMETNVEEVDRNLRDVNEHLEYLKLKQMEFIEMNEILLKTHKLLEFSRRERASSFRVDVATSEENGESATTRFHRADNEKLYTVTGLIRNDKTASFHKLIWRLCNNNALVQFYEIDAPIDDVRTNELVPKKVFMIMCQGDRLHNKVLKICEGFHASIYALPEDDDSYREMCTQVETNLKDLKLVIDQTLKQKYRILMGVAQKENLATWVVQVTKLRAVFNIMNLYNKTDKGFLAECWCARTDFNKLKDTIDEVARKSGVQGQALVEVLTTSTTPPTYFRLNKFTEGFQNIVDSYGVANYQEVNPMPYTIISFPFLFAVMFADAGHGFIMFLFALYLVLQEKKLAKVAASSEIFGTFFTGRYIILLMGLFSIYTGFIYNDIFAKSANIFGTSFEVPPKQYPGEGVLPYFQNHSIYLNKSDTTYVFGIDAAWQLSDNKIMFLNSFKMKTSVILGVLQMFFGVILSFFNHIHFGNYSSIFFEFIPQVCFMLSLFGYLIGMIFAKWIMTWEPSKAPSLLIDFINMFLMKYPHEKPDPEYLWPWYPHKKEIQTGLLGLALLSVPVMLLVKPMIKVCCRPAKRSKVNGDVESSVIQDSANKSGEHDEEHESAMDIYIHQAIHTIEYCLGSISHTASYLRLWALSLAHTQLSEVLWKMVMRRGFSSSGNKYVGAAMTFATFTGWSVLTVAILIVMEGLSAFLHALRLHWVEFQSKFYTGSGVSFKPFNFVAILQETNILNE